MSNGKNKNANDVCFRKEAGEQDGIKYNWGI